jgi:hypothetical protein
LKFYENYIIIKIYLHKINKKKIIKIKFYMIYTYIY